MLLFRYLLICVCMFKFSFASFAVLHLKDNEYGVQLYDCNVIKTNHNHFFYFGMIRQYDTGANPR